MKTINVDVTGGTLSPGETITIVLGDTSGGSNGIRMQSFTENQFEFKALVDVFETGDPMEVPGSSSFKVTSGPETSLTPVLPSGVRQGEEVRMYVRAEDRWGNIARDCSRRLIFEARAEDVSVPETKRLIEGVAEVPVEFKTQGIHRIAVTSENDNLEATTNPTLCDEDRNTRVFWGDLHGQSEETIGTGSIDHYFEFARERGFLNFVAPANHDFQMSDHLWERVIEAVSYHHDPCDFVTSLGYEWSSNTPIGGDHNVYFLKEEGELFRSSDWMVANEGSGHTEGTYPVKELYNRFEGRDDVLIIPHQGGRPANLEVLDPERTPFVELLSL